MKEFIYNILRDIYISFNSYFGIAITIVFLAFAAWITVQLYRLKFHNTIPEINKYKLKKYIFVFALIGCCTMIAYETIFSRGANSRDSLSLVFYFEDIRNLAGAGRYLLENVVLFMPFGFLVAGLCKKRFRFLKTCFISFIGSLSIETTQLITGRGYFQISDLIANTCGGASGALIYIIIIAILNKFIL